MTEVVILGGGFAGVAAIKQLQRDKSNHITLVSQEPYHVFHASLYEVATSELPQKSIAIPLSEIFGKHVTCIKKTVHAVKPNTHEVTLTDGMKLYYDQLLIALGSVPACFGVPGLTEYGYPLKTLSDAIHIKEALKHLFAAPRMTHPIRIIIGGGGFSGVELAMELVHYARKLSAKNDSSPFTMTIIQGSESLLKELHPEISHIALARAKRFLIGVYTKEHIIHVTRKHVETDAGKFYEYDLLIWTGGVEAQSLGKTSGFSVNKKKQILTNEYLQVPAYPNVFVAGDIAAPPEQVAWTAINAIAQGKLAGRNMLRHKTRKTLLAYEPEPAKYIVPMYGKFAVAELPYLHLVGFSAWLLQQLVFLRYLTSILPLTKAFNRWTYDETELISH